VNEVARPQAELIVRAQASGWPRPEQLLNQTAAAEPSGALSKDVHGKNTPKYSFTFLAVTSLRES
jgi:hypothetical protein